MISPQPVLALNAGVLRKFNQEPCVVRGPREVGPELPARSLVLCGWQEEMPSSGEQWYLAYYGAEIQGLGVIQPYDREAFGEWIVSSPVQQAMRAAWSAGRPVLITDTFMRRCGSQLPGIDPRPFLSKPCLSMHRVLPLPSE